MNNIKHLLACILLAVTISGCTIEWRGSNRDYTNSSYSTSGFPIDACYEEPYWHSPEWCDYYGDATCCVWYADGWYEEWCQWDYDWCWEYNGSW